MYTNCNDNFDYTNEVMLEFNVVIAGYLKHICVTNVGNILVQIE